MVKIAIDVVILPPEWIMDKVIEINKELDRDRYVLNKENCIPHVSLCMGIIEEKDTSRIKELLQTISERFSPIKIEIDNIGIHTTSEDLKISGFNLRKGKELQALHEEIVKNLEPFFKGKATPDMLAYSAGVRESSLETIENYTKKSSFEKFEPHISLGFGTTERTDFPSSFKASKLAMCHLGSDCTCIKILFSTEIKEDK